MLGLLVGATFVWNINELQDALASTLGFRMWNAEVYYFDRIPTDLDSLEVTGIVAIAIISSAVGSLLPALWAARLDPVKTLRYE